MKKFVKKTVLFISIILTISIVSQYLIEKMVSDPAMECALNEKLNADIIIMGNSRACYNYSTSVFDSLCQLKTFNLGICGFPVDFQYKLRLIPYLNRNTKPKLILQEINTIAFLDDFNNPKQFRFLKYNRLPEYKYYNEYINSPCYEKHIPLVKYRGMLNTKLFKKKWNKIVAQRYKCYNNTKSNDSSIEINNDETNFKRQNYLSLGYYYTVIDSVKLTVFEEYLNQCNNENIKLVLVFSPMYYELVDGTINIENFWQEITTLASRYNVPILNYSHDTLCYDSTFFIDYTHMNRIGADKFTLKLINDMNSMGISNYLYNVSEGSPDCN